MAPVSTEDPQTKPAGEESGDIGGETPTDGAVPQDDPQKILLDVVDAMKAELAQRDRKLRDYIEAHQRAVQEMDAARKRMERDREEELDRHRGELAKTLLDVVDDLDRILASIDCSPDLQTLLDGISLVRERVTAKLGELGVRPMNAVGEIFDPNLHEAVGLVPVPDEEQDQRILAEELAGYLFKERTLRAARVIVGAFKP